MIKSNKLIIGNHYIQQIFIKIRSICQQFRFQGLFQKIQDCVQQDARRKPYNNVNYIISKYQYIRVVLPQGKDVIDQAKLPRLKPYLTTNHLLINIR